MRITLKRAWATLKSITNSDLYTEFLNVQKAWNDHDSGILQWSNVAVMSLNGSNSTLLGCPTAAINSSGMTNGQVNIWLDEAGNKLTFKVKYSSGTVKSGTVALV